MTMMTQLSLLIFLLLILLPVFQAIRVRKPPSIFRQSNKEIIFREDDPEIMLYCEASGNPTPRYEWVKNGKRLHLGGDYERVGNYGSVSLKRPRYDKEGFYQCKAINKYGIAISSIFYVIKARNVAFPYKQQVLQMATTISESFTLFCNPPYGSVPNPSYVWALALKVRDNVYSYQPVTSDGGRRTIDGQGNLHFAFVKKEDGTTGQHLYKCGVHNSLFHSNNYGRPTTLSVKSGENIGMNHAPDKMWTSMNGLKPEVKAVSILRGQSITLQCIFSGKPVPNVTWEKVNGPLPPGHTYSQDDHQHQKITLHNLNYEDSGDYICTGHNSVGRSRQTIKLQVDASPYWVSEPPKDQFLVEGKSAVFSCRSLGKPEPKVSFFVNGIKESDLKPDQRRYIYGDSITFSKLNSSDLQVVQCNVSNRHGYLFADAFLNVIKKTVITLAPEPVYLDKVLRTVKFVCDGFTDPSTEKMIHWFMDNKPITNSTEMISISEDGRVLKIDTKKAQQYVGREYMCVLDNGHNNTDSAKAFLHYSGEPPPVSAAVTKEKGNVWWAGAVVGFIVVLLSISLVLYIIYKRGTGTYPVNRLERKAGHNPIKELAGHLFRAYSRQDLEPIRGRRSSIIEAGSASTLFDGSGVDSDDSLGGYSDINAERFQEDGSFVGKYVTKKKKFDSYDNPEKQTELRVDLMPNGNGVPNKHNYENIENYHMNSVL